MGAQNLDWQFAVQAGGVGAECTCTSLCTDADGNIYVAGGFSVAIAFGDSTLTSSGGLDIFVAKLDPWGNWLWATRVGSYGSDKANGIAIDPDGNLLVTGVFANTVRFGDLAILTSTGSSDFFVAKITTNGNWVWSSRAGGTAYDLANALALDAQGNIYVTGYFQGTCLFPGLSSVVSSGSSDFYLAKMNNTGNWVWARSAGGNNSDSGKAVQTDQDGNVIVAGQFRGDFSFGPLTFQPDSNYTVFLAKADPEGNWIWANTHGGAGSAYLGDFCVGPLGDIYLTGYFNATLSFASHTVSNVGGNDIFIAKASSTGAWQWALRCGGNDNDTVGSIEVDSEGNLWIAGTFEFPILFGDLSLSSLGVYDIYIAKLNPSGSFTWAVRTGGTNSEYYGDFWLDELDNAFICGSFNGSTTLGNEQLTNLGSTDAFVLKYGLAYILLSPQEVSIAVTDDDVLISWDAVSGASAYKVETADQPYGDYVDISSSGVFTDNSFSITLPQANKRFYQVKALRE